MLNRKYLPIIIFWGVVPEISFIFEFDLSVIAMCHIRSKFDTVFDLSCAPAGQTDIARLTTNILKRMSSKETWDL